MNATNEPEVLAKQIWQQIEQKDKIIQNGEVFDLSDMEAEVKAFCEMLGKLPPQDARRFEEDLKNIMDKLVEWATVLEERKRQVLQGAKGLNTQSKAQKAYITAASSFKKPDNDAK